MPLVFAVFVGNSDVVRMILAAYGDKAGLDVVLHGGIEGSPDEFEGLTALSLARIKLDLYKEACSNGEPMAGGVTAYEEIVSMLEAPQDVTFDFESFLGGRTEQEDDGDMIPVGRTEDGGAIMMPREMFEQMFGRPEDLPETVDITNLARVDPVLPVVDAESEVDQSEEEDTFYLSRQSDGFAPLTPTTAASTPRAASVWPHMEAQKQDQKSQQQPQRQFQELHQDEPKASKCFLSEWLFKLFK